MHGNPAAKKDFGLTRKRGLTSVGQSVSQVPSHFVDRVSASLTSSRRNFGDV